MDHPHPVEQLFEHLQDLRPFVGGMVEIYQHLPGLGFFPGGDGLWKAPGQQSRPPMPIGGIMVLGNNFQCEANYPALLETGEENRQKDATWRGLLNFLATVHIPPSKCFFTNAYPALVEGDDPKRTVRGMSDPEFLKRCRAFFLRQLALVQPRIILALGTKVPTFLAPLAEQTRHWDRATTWADIDRMDGCFAKDVLFTSQTPPVSIACLLHPSFRGPNLRRRKFRNLTGAAAEVALVADALRSAGM